MTLSELEEMAASEGWLVRPPTLERRPIKAESGEMVGFFCPHPAGRGRTRVGPIFVAPPHRGKGLALQAYDATPGALVAYVHAGNVASERLHEKAGFALWYKTKAGAYWRRG